MAKRKYTKRSDYWNKLQTQGKKAMIEPASKKEGWGPIGENQFEQAVADISLGNNNTTYAQTQFGRSALEGKPEFRFPHLSQSPLPYTNNNDVVTVTDAVILCQKAYANVAIFRNTIDILAEFANRPIHIESKDHRTERFFKNWFKKIRLNEIKRQFFLEMFRSCNVALYRFDGSFEEADFKDLRTRYQARVNSIPVKYTIMNPAFLGVQVGPVGRETYVRALSSFEIEKLRHPKTKEDQKAFDALPPEVKKQILQTSGVTQNNNIYMPVEPENARFVFYKKQDYEEMAMPMGYPILDDIEFKLALKDMDKKVSQAAQRMILLITMGKDGEVNQKLKKQIEDIFQKPAAGRVIISDDTTTAQFVIPELKDILGPEKYTTVNEDIKVGLQNILAGEEKFSNQMIKVKVMLQRLEDAQDIFLEEFLIPEMKGVCENMNFRECPNVKFEKINLEDDNQRARWIIRLMELGALTPQETFEAFNSGLLPSEELSLEDQKRFQEQRDQRLFQPLLNSGQNENGRPNGSGGPQENDRSPRVTGESSAGDAGSAFDYNVDSSTDKQERFTVTQAAVTDVCHKLDDLVKSAESRLKQQKNKKRLNKQEKEFCLDLSWAVAEGSSINKWDSTLQDCLEKKVPPESNKVTKQVESLARELDCDTKDAVLYYHASKEKV